MTGYEPAPEVDSTLVLADRPPELPAGEFVDVRPGPVVAFDGTRRRAPVDVVAPDGGSRRYGRHEVLALLAAVRRQLREGSAAFVRFGDRSRLCAMWSSRAVADVERRLLATARLRGASVVAWTDADRGPTDGAAYDRVLSR